MNRVWYPILIVVACLFAQACAQIDKEALDSLLENPSVAPVVGQVSDILDASESLVTDTHKTVPHARALIKNADGLVQCASQLLPWTVFLFAIYVATRVISLFQFASINKQLAKISATAKTLTDPGLSS